MGIRSGSLVCNAAPRSHLGRGSANFDVPLVQSQVGHSDSKLTMRTEPAIGTGSVGRFAPWPGYGSIRPDPAGFELAWACSPNASLTIATPITQVTLG